MIRTTILASSEVLLAMRAIAERRRVSVSEAIRSALEAFVEKEAPPKRRFSFVGIGASGGKLRVSERVDELLYQEQGKEIMRRRR